MTVSAGLIQLFLLDAQMICFLPERHWKHTNQWCFAIYFLVFISFLKLCLCMCVCVCMCTWVCTACVSQKRAVGSPRPGFMDGCEPFELGAGNKPGNLQGQLFSEPVIYLPNSCCSYCFLLLSFATSLKRSTHLKSQGRLSWIILWTEQVLSYSHNISLTFKRPPGRDF